MSHPATYQWIKLGMNLEYLRGVATASITPAVNLAPFPDLAENLPARRFDASRVTEVIRSLLIQLDEFGLPHSLAAADSLRPMLAQVEAYIRDNPIAPSIVLQDAFANKIVSTAKQISLVLKNELAARGD